MAEVAKVAWLVSALNFDVASTRYRAIYPAAGLAQDGVQSLLFDRPEKIRPMLGELSALVIVKRLDPAIIQIVSLANDAGVPVILDLCDDVLDIDYRDESHEMFRMVFDAISPRISTIVTTGHALKRRFAAYGVDADKIKIIPDCMETDEIAALGQAFLANCKGDDRSVVGAAHGGRLLHIRQAALRAAKAIRHPRRSALDWRRTLHTIRYGEPAAAARPSAVADDPDLRKALGLGGRIVVWFGNHGGPHSDFGMLTMLKVANELKEAYDRAPFTLIVVSDNKEKWKLFIEPIGIPTRFVPWSHAGCRALLKKAWAFIMPVGDDHFSLSKSANRALLALEAGTPVVSQSLESLDDLRPGVSGAAFAQALERCLTRREEAQSDAAAARAQAKGAFGLRPTIEKWRETLAAAKPYSKSRARYGASDGSEKLLVMINLAQDLPIALPVLDEARRRGTPVAVIVGAEAARAGRNVLDAMIERRIAPTFMPANAAARRDFRWLRSATALFCPTESTAPAHRLSNYLANVASAAGVPTFTAQHGLENLGLTYREAEAGAVAIASRTIFTWRDPASLPDWLEGDIRARCVGVGRIAARVRSQASAKTRGTRERPLVAVFENLHWARYSEKARSDFTAAVRDLADRNPGADIVLMAHPGGRWAIGLKAALMPGNVEIVDPNESEQKRWTTPQLLAAAQAVITTPSTIAADAAEIGAPVAIARCGLADLGAYAPLAIVDTAGEWTAFAVGAAHGAPWQANAEFLARIRLPGDPTARIVDMMLPGSAAEARQARARLVGGE